MSIQTIMTIRQQPLLKVRMVTQERGKDMQKQFAAGKQPDPDVIKKTKDVQEEFIASQQQVQTDADRAIFETMKRQQQLTEILTKSQLDILGTMKGDTTEAKRPDFYSQVLRRQVLPIIQRAIARLKEFTKPLTTSRKTQRRLKEVRQVARSVHRQAKASEVRQCEFLLLWAQKITRKQQVPGGTGLRLLPSGDWQISSRAERYSGIQIRVNMGYSQPSKQLATTHLDRFVRTK